MVFLCYPWVQMQYFIELICSLWLLGWKMISDYTRQTDTCTHAHMVLSTLPPTTIVQTTTVSCQDFCDGLFPSLFGSKWTSLWLVWDLDPIVTAHSPQDTITPSIAFEDLPTLHALSPLPSSSHLRFQAKATLNSMWCVLLFLGLWINLSV